MDAWIALVGPELEENLSLRYLAGSLRRAGFDTEIFAFNQGSQLPELVKRLTTGTPPLLIGLSLSFQWRAHDVMALALGLRERPAIAGTSPAAGTSAPSRRSTSWATSPSSTRSAGRKPRRRSSSSRSTSQRGTPWQGLAGLALRGRGRGSAAQRRCARARAGHACPGRCAMASRPRRSVTASRRW